MNSAPRSVCEKNTHAVSAARQCLAGAEGLVSTVLGWTQARPMFGEARATTLSPPPAVAADGTSPSADPPPFPCLLYTPCLWLSLGSVIYIYHDHPLSIAMAFHSHSNSHSQSYHSLDGATILSWAHDPDCQHTIACDTIEEGSLNHWAPTYTLQ